MNEGRVTAVVLLSGSTSALTLESTAAAVTAQSRPADRIVAIAPSSLEAEAGALLEDLLERGDVDEVLTTSGAVGRAGAVREALDLLDRRPAASGPQGPDAEAATEASTEDDTEPGAAGELEASPGRSSGRRALAVDPEAVERRRTQDAEKLAQVPQRLREERRSGRRAATSSADESWLWFVVDEATPGPQALAELLHLAADSPNTAVVGPKRVRFSGTAAAAADPAQRSAEQADALVDVGITLTHGGRIITGVDPGEIDQGQVDWRQDVLAVALPGMLIREETLREVGGLDPDLPTPWAEIDLCHRVWRHGERVAVQSDARVLFPDPEGPRRQRMQEQRTGQLLLLLKHRSTLMAMLMLLLSPVTTLLRMAAAVAASTPRRAVMELRAWLAALARAPRVLRRGAGDSRRARVPRGRLAPLYLPRGESMRRRLDDAWTRLVADDEHNRRIRHTTWGIAGTRNSIEDVDYGRHVAWTLAVGAASVVLSLLALRSLFGRGALVGPGLLPLPEAWQDGWEAAWSTWVPRGLGVRGPGDPLVRLLGHLPTTGGTLVEVIVFTAVPLSALTAWWAAGALTRAVGARLALAVTWALAPSLLSALTIGSWPLLLVHALLPLLALAIGRAIGLPHKIARASAGAAAAAGLLLLVIGAVQPLLVVLSALALALIAPSVPGRRRRLLWVLIPSLALHAPYLPAYLDRPAQLLAVGGVPPMPTTASATDLFMLWPVTPGIIEALTPWVGATAAQLLPVLPLLPVLVAALLAPLLAGDAGRAGRLGVLLAAAGLVAALLARDTMVAVSGDQLVAAPLHGLLSMTLLALMIGAGAAFDALARRAPEDSRTRRVGTAALAAVVACVCAVTVVGWSVLLPEQLEVQRSTSGQVPAAAADQGRTEARTRVLVLETDTDDGVRASLVVHGGESIIQQSAAAELRDVQTVRSGTAVDEDPGSVALREAVATMLSGDSGEEAVADTLAVGYVIVPGDTSEQLDLVESLDASDLLEKVTEGDGGGMWRIIDASPRAAVVGGAEPIALSSGAVPASGTVPADESERTVVLSERYDTQWRATLAGTDLQPVLVDDWAQGFTIPAGASGELELNRHQPGLLAWQVTLYVALALTVLIAIPWRPRSRAVEEMYG